MITKGTVAIIVSLGTIALPVGAESDKQPNPYYRATVPLPSGHLSAKETLERQQEWREWHRNVSKSLFSKVFDDTKDLKLPCDLKAEMHLKYTVLGDGTVNDVQGN